MTVRQMVQSDDLIVSRIVSEGYRFIAEPDGLTREQLAGLIEERCQPEHMAVLRHRCDCSVAEINGDVVGIVAVRGDSIEDLWVRPSRHRNGIGTALFRHAESSVRRAGHPKLMVCTTGYGKPFYEAMDMQTVGVCPVTYGPLVGRELTVLEKELQR